MSLCERKSQPNGVNEPGRGQLLYFSKANSCNPSKGREYSVGVLGTNIKSCCVRVLCLLGPQRTPPK